MEITEIRVKLVENPRERLLAFCTVTFQREFVVRDVKIIDGPRGPFVAMPSRKVMDRCPQCHGKNHLRARFCNECGASLHGDRAVLDGRGRPRLHVDVAHPINQQCRAEIEGRILEAYQMEQVRASQPGYVAPDLEDIDDYSYEPEEVANGERGVAHAEQNGHAHGNGERRPQGGARRGPRRERSARDGGELQAG